jgi:hypothetical protein
MDVKAGHTPILCLFGLGLTASIGCTILGTLHGAAESWNLAALSGHRQESRKDPAFPLECSTTGTEKAASVTNPFVSFRKRRSYDR